MKTIYRLAKTELGILFYSPIAWLILIIFTFQVSMNYTDLIKNTVRRQDLGYGAYNVTMSWLAGMRGIIYKMLGYIYLYIPLLTMGLMSRELSSGSIKLLYSSPVTNTQIILGKYMGVVVYTLILVAILMVYVVFGLFTIEAMDWPAVMAGVLGLFLLTCAYGAIGLFMSTLTSYQVVAAMGTLAILAVLNFVGRIGQSIDFVRDITYWLSISGRANEMVDGMICSEDVIYFLVVIGLFVMLSILKLQGERTRYPIALSIGRYLGVIALALLIGYMSSRPSLMFYHDATATKQRTLTKASQEVMEKMDGGLTITTYVNLLDGNYWQGMPANRNNDRREFKQYIRFKPEIKMNYVYYYDEVPNSFLKKQYPTMTNAQRARKIIQVNGYDSTLFLSPEKFRQIIDLRSEENRFVRLIERENGNKTFLRTYTDNQRMPSETEITAALKRLVEKSPKVGFLTGHGEREIGRDGDRDYSLVALDKHFRYSLLNQGFDPIQISLANGAKIPADIDILVITELKEPLLAEELQELEKYINRGGNLLLAPEVSRQENMNPLGAMLGMHFMPGCLVQISDTHDPDLAVGDFTEAAAAFSDDLEYLKKRNYRMTFPGAVGHVFTEEKGFQQTVLVAAHDTVDCWNEVETTDFRDEVPVWNEKAGELKTSYPLVSLLTRQVGDKEQRVFVLADADCLSNGELNRTRSGIKGGNFSAELEFFKALCYGRFPINTTRPVPPDDKVYLTMSDMFYVNGFFIGLLPGILLIWSLLLWWRRRGK